VFSQHRVHHNQIAVTAMNAPQNTGSDKRDVAELFRERMQLLISQRDQSLAAFANSVGIDRSALTQFMAPGSTRLPRAETLHSIARTCGVSLDWLLGLTASREDGNDASAPMLELQHTGNLLNSQLLEQWHREALGYKIRYIPATLPDLLRTEAVGQIEFFNYDREQLAAVEEQSRSQLSYSRRPETDMEVCMSLQSLELFAHGLGIWEKVSMEIRSEQLRHMADLIDELYPTFRLFLFDQRALYPSPYTVFGPKRAALYLGNMYLVVNSVEHIKALTRHFDGLIKIARIGPDRASRHIRKLQTQI
jgi:transcriptional regulator with XRE-family HTH domain